MNLDVPPRDECRRTGRVSRMVRRARKHYTSDSSEFRYGKRDNSYRDIVAIILMGINDELSPPGAILGTGVNLQRL